MAVCVQIEQQVTEFGGGDKAHYGSHPIMLLWQPAPYLAIFAGTAWAWLYGGVLVHSGASSAIARSNHFGSAAPRQSGRNSGQGRMAIGVKVAFRRGRRFAGSPGSVIGISPSLAQVGHCRGQGSIGRNDSRPPGSSHLGSLRRVASGRSILSRYRRQRSRFGGILTQMTPLSLHRSVACSTIWAGDGSLDRGRLTWAALLLMQSRRHAGQHPPGPDQFL
jgi:hypothetical protein